EQQMGAASEPLATRLDPGTLVHPSTRQPHWSTYFGFLSCGWSGAASASGGLVLNSAMLLDDRTRGLSGFAADFGAGGGLTLAPPHAARQRPSYPSSNRNRDHEKSDVGAAGPGIHCKRAPVCKISGKQHAPLLTTARIPTSGAAWRNFNAVDVGFGS